MAQQNIPAQPSPKTVQYANLLGVDYQGDATEISRYRSPRMVNMISDEGGNPVKRYGYRQICDADYAGIVLVNGANWAVRKTAGSIYAVQVEFDEKGKLTEVEYTNAYLCSRSGGEIKHVFSAKSKIYVLCEKVWLSYDPATHAKEQIGIAEGISYTIYNVGTPSEPSYAMDLIWPKDTFIPTVMTMYKPSGNELVSLPAGTEITGSTQGVNILTPFRRVEYCVQTDTATETQFIIPSYAKVSPTIKVEVLDKDTFEWKELSSDDYTVSALSLIPVRLMDDIHSVKFNCIDGVVTLDSAPYDKITVSDEPKLVFADDHNKVVPAGVPNVRITFAPVSMEDDRELIETEELDTYTTSVDDDYLVITLDEDPYTNIYLDAEVDGIEYGLAFEVGYPSYLRYETLHVTYDGEKTLRLDNALICSDSLIASDTLILAGVLSEDVIKSVKYDHLVWVDERYRGFYNADRERLLASDAYEVYDSRLFVADGIRTYYSRASSMFVIDDNFYFDVDNKVMLYGKTSSALSVITEDVGKDVIYLAKGDYNDELGMPVYSIKASNAGKGAITPKVDGILNDEPMFLAKTGIFGITTNYYSEKFSISRSGKLNRRLLKEPNLHNAVGVNYRDYFFVAVNGHMYILDGRHKDASRNGDNSYESYYFDHLPVITKLWVVGDRMIWGDGEHLYTWNNDLDKNRQYIDNAVWNEDTERWEGQPVKCLWSSVIDSDGYPQYYKVLNKKGSMVTIAPPMQTSCQITVVKDGNQRYYLGRFNGATFALTDSVLDAFTKKKIKKYKRLQFIVENKEPEPFGIVSIVKTFTIGNLAKR